VEDGSLRGGFSSVAGGSVRIPDARAVEQADAVTAGTNVAREVLMRLIRIADRHRRLVDRNADDGKVAAGRDHLVPGVEIEPMFVPPLYLGRVPVIKPLNGLKLSQYERRFAAELGNRLVIPVELNVGLHRQLIQVAEISLGYESLLKVAVFAGENEVVEGVGVIRAQKILRSFLGVHYLFDLHSGRQELPG
jgi:hypothetical protein